LRNRHLLRMNIVKKRKFSYCLTVFIRRRCRW
jgi:hypothetical protein